jgi:bile acid:Na+ symporter, BASS family
MDYANFCKMNRLRAFLLPVAILIGLLTPGSLQLSWVVRWLLAFMLFIAFLGFPGFRWETVRNLLLRTLPVWILLAPIGYLLLRFMVPEDQDVAWAIFFVLVAPTATAAPVVARFRGGDPLPVLASVLVTHLLLMGWLPLLCGWFDANMLNPWAVSWKIFRETLPFLLVPILASFVLQKWMPAAAAKLQPLQRFSILLWAVAVWIVVASTKSSLANSFDLQKFAMIASLSLVACILQFQIGRRLSSTSPEESSQMLGQKNTILVLWISSTYFGFWASIGPLSYVVWQNLYIAWQSAFPTLRNR